MCNIALYCHFQEKSFVCLGEFGYKTAFKKRIQNRVETTNFFTNLKTGFEPYHSVFFPTISEFVFQTIIYNLA